MRSYRLLLLSCAAVLPVLSAAAGEPASGGRPAAGAPPKGKTEASADRLTLPLAKGAVAEFDEKARLLIRVGKELRIRGALRVSGKKGAAGQAGMSVRRVSDGAAAVTWGIRGEDAPGGARAELRAIRLEKGAALACELNFRRPEELESWGYALDLPAKGLSGLTLKAGGRTVTLPAAPAAGRKSVIFRGRVRSLRLLKGKKTVLRAVRDVPAFLTIRDLRAAGGKGFRATFEGAAADLAGPAWGRFCLGFVAGDARLAPLVYHARAWPPIEPGGPIRTEIGLLADYGSPFNPEHVKVDALVAAPGGRTFRHPAFYAREYFSRVEMTEPAAKGKGAKAAPEPGEEKPKAVEVEHLDPLGEPGWRALVDAARTGLYRITVEARTPAGVGSRRARPLRLVRTASRRMGPLARSTKDRRYLVDPQGKPVFLLGHNLGWLVDERGPLSLDRWRAALDRMKAAELNYARVWNCTWSLWLERDRPYGYDLASAWKLDRILTEAAGRGIHVQLCMDNFHDFRMKREKSPYFSGAAPVCKTTRDFFTGEAARKMYSAKLRYMVARYGHHPNLMAWELWNELDYCIDKKAKPEELVAARKEYLVPWARAAARELAALDRRRRLITCSLADGTLWPELTGAPEMGLAESHVYLYMPDVEGKRPARSARAALAEASSRFARFGKPGFVSEFGFGASGGPESPINDTDRLGIHLHNGLWASALSGHAGAVALWWWDSYLAPPGKGEAAKTEVTGEDRYWHYRSVGRFLKGVDWLAGWKPLTVSPPKAGARYTLITGMRTDREVLIWIADPANTWYNRAVKGYKPAKFPKSAFTVDGLVPGQYLITWWDTYAAKERTSSRQLTDEAGRLRVNVPGFHRDVAARIRLMSRLKDAGEPGEK